MRYAGRASDTNRDPTLQRFRSVGHQLGVHRKHVPSDRPCLWTAEFGTNRQFNQAQK